MNSTELLNQIHNEWATGRASHRDSRVRVGRMIREYIGACLMEAAGLNEHDRRLVKTSNRSDAVQALRQKLKISHTMVNELIRVSAVVDLLCPDRDLGTASYTSLRILRAFIHRPNRGKQIQRGRHKHDDEIEPADIEVWTVRKGYEKKGKELAARMIDEEWDSNRVRTETYAVIGQLRKRSSTGTYVDTQSKRRDIVLTDGKGPRYEETITSESDTTNTIGAKIPQDRDEMVEQAVNLCLAYDDPDAFIEMLRRRLENIRAAKKHNITVARESVPLSREDRLKLYEQQARHGKPIGNRA